MHMKYEKFDKEKKIMKNCFIYVYMYHLKKKIK